MGMMRELDDIDESLARLRYDLCGLKFEMKFRKWIDRKAGFDPDQPRDPQGMWTAGGAGTSGDETATGENHVSATFADLASVPFAARFEELPGGNDSNTTEDLLHDIAATITQNTARTGIPTIDDMTEKLTDTLKDVMDIVDVIPEQLPSVYGVAVHTAFATSIKAQNLEGVTVEESFSLADTTRYGAAGSIRTDVTLRNVAGDVIAIYDLKTGGAVLTASRADQLREQTGAGSYTPVIELHFQRGSRLKHEQVTQGLSIDPAVGAWHGHVRSVSDHQTDRLHCARLLPR